ncbi:MAG: peptidylprolyl isomerase [Chloroflexi bacterium]|nr:peptidylprolyl isomerase [Chloroflexota bacterium]
MQWPEPPAMTIDTARNYEAVLRTAKGDIRIQLYDDLVPLTVNNFVFLARQGYYDGVTFHRVISGFMAQSGDPTGTGSGGPGYQFADEFSPQLRHDSEGIVSMANAGANTNGSQFFITYAPQPHLDDKHSVFGKVIEGMDVVRALTPRDPDAGGPAGDVINTVEIIEH